MTDDHLHFQAYDKDSDVTDTGTTSHDEPGPCHRISRTPRPSVIEAMHRNEVPEDPVARFEYYDALTNLFVVRFLRDGSNSKEVMFYSDQAKTHIPPGYEDSLFFDGGFGDSYVFLRMYAWNQENTPQNSRLLVDAIEWKIEVAPKLVTLRDVALRGLGKVGVYEQEKDEPSLREAIYSCEEYLTALQDAPEAGSVSDPDEVAEHGELFVSVSSCLSRLLYHQFRLSGEKAVLERCMRLGNDVLMDVPDAERPELVTSLTQASIAYSFNYKAFDVPRTEQYVYDWSHLDGEETSSTVPNMPPLRSGLKNDLYDGLQLAPDNTQIRLVQVQCGHHESEIVCVLEVVDLATCPTYDALSYVWGDPALTDSIILQGKPHEVTMNLHDALARLRLPDKHRRVWIDAVCINQKDMKEKEGQIGLMDKIYAKAEEVCMWLGEPARMHAFANDPRDIPCHLKAAELLEAMLPGVYNQIKPYLSILGDPEFELTSSANAMDLATILYQLPFCMRPIPSAPDNSLLKGFAPEQIEKGISADIAALLEATSSINLCMDLEEVQKRNTWYQAATMNAPEYYSWENELQTPFYLESKMTGSEWPIVGAFLLINLLAMDYHFHDFPFFGATGYPSVLGKTAQAWNKSCYALYHLLSNKYWTRAWILQELVLARSPKLYFGKHALPYHQLVQAMVNFKRHYSTCCKDVVPADEIAACASQSWWLRLHSAFANFIETPSEMWYARQFKESQSDDPSSSITAVLFSHFKKRQATEPRDMIFSMLGLIRNNGSDRIPIDYAAPLEQVYAQATFRALKETKDHSLLTFAGYGRTDKLKYKLPSWCVDFTAPLEWSGPFPDMSPLFHAFPGSEVDAQMEPDLCLSVTSAKVDVVVKVSSASQCCSHQEWSDTIHNINQWRECATLPIGTTKSPSTNCEKSFWSTILGGCLAASDSALQSSPFSYERLTDSDYVLIDQWQTWLHDPGRMCGQSDFQERHPRTYNVDWLRKAEAFARLNRRLHHSMMYRRLFVSQKGRPGSGAGNDDSSHFTRVEIGDEVHLVSGCRMPVVLRPIDLVNCGGASYGNDPAEFSADVGNCVHDASRVYQLVGPCFVDGLMDGEATHEKEFATKRIFLR